ncbi:MAG: glycosyltransferase [Maritimibacter sp.]|uniref:capsular polysaccharide export protein, LipB/KpsS family n=1 Tax=Maritimibacter sp. TaxID=2003363 RepID=UPI001DAF7569|nr:glycosyltransferase [Maritimibacter sp.]MBL6426548.1 glycosyltransferase [Maritimibacter sp.]
MKQNDRAFRRFVELLDQRQVRHDPTIDIREHVLARRTHKIGVGYINDNLTRFFGANLRRLFPAAVGVDDSAFAKSRDFLISGSIYRDPEHSHKGGVRALDAMPEGTDPIFFEAGFVATSHSWAHSFKEGNASYACLGYVYDDIAYYFMADYPNRLIHRLNSDRELSDAERARARGLIDRLVERRISKYNAQPMEAPTLPEGYDRAVLVCDQAFADASTVYGKLTESDFERMLIAALTENPDAQVIVKTHPDSSWEKGKRSGYYTHLETTGRIVVLRDPVNPYTIFDMVDTVYVGTSQMGLEALFAGKKVVTFGAPFYGGWGLTDDRQAIPHRHRSRTLEDIFHAFYIWYTIYHVPGCAVPSQVEDALDYIETHRPFPLPPTQAELDTPPKVSVIIPVHGVEAYIEDCIASVQAQTLREIEILPVNDVTPDNAQAIIDRLAKADPRIKPIVLDENVGQGFARNIAIDQAKGDFIWFIDGDDWMPNPEALETLVAVAEANGSDMVRGKKAAEAVFAKNGEYIYDRPDASEANFDQQIDRTTYAETPRILRNRHFWTWLYRRDWLNEIEGRFVTTQWEERAFLVRALTNARVLSLTTCPTTTYRIRPASTARRKRGPKDFDRMFMNFETTLQALGDHGARDRTSPLRPHLAFHMSQYIDHMILTEPYAYYQEMGGDAFQTFLDRVRGTLESYDFRAGDYDATSTERRVQHNRAGAFQLAIAALRAGRPDLLDAAVNLRPIPQDELYEVYRQAPETPDDSDLQAALNHYARNGLVKTQAGRAPKPGKRPRIVVHIGATKTGSTFLQHLMETNRPALMRDGVWYPEVGLFWQRVRPHKQAGHSEFTRNAVRNEPGLRAHIEHGLALMGERIHTIVLSSEAFFLQENAYQIANYFADYDVEMVVYLRRQDEWANAQYAEFVAGGAVGRVDGSFAEWLTTPETIARLDYAANIERWAEVIGKNKVKVRLFDKRAFEGGDLLADFAKVTDLPVLLDLPQPDALQANSARLSTAHVELVRMYNAREFRNRDAYFTFIETVTTGFQKFRADRGLQMGRPRFLTEELAETLMRNARDTNAAIARTYFGREDGVLFDGEAQRPPAQDDALHAGEFALVAAAYDAAKPEDVVDTGVPDRLTQRATGPRVVNYGHFGWRLWLLTPIFETLYVKRAMPEVLPAFRREPADFARENWAQYTPFRIGLLYPNTPALGGFKVWVPIIRTALKLTGNTGMIPALERDPIAFMRASPSKPGRILSRIVFPRGEIR